MNTRKFLSVSIALGFVLTLVGMFALPMQASATTTPDPACYSNNNPATIYNVYAKDTYTGNRGYHVGWNFEINQCMTKRKIDGGIVETICHLYPSVVSHRVGSSTLIPHERTSTWGRYTADRKGMTSTDRCVVKVTVVFYNPASIEAFEIPVIDRWIKYISRCNVYLSFTGKNTHVEVLRCWTADVIKR